MSEQNNQKPVIEVKQEIFADGLGQIHFNGNVMRMDFVAIKPETAVPAEGQDGVQNMGIFVPVRIVMTPKDFLAAFSNMQKMITQLVEQGVLEVTQPKKEEPTQAE